MAKWNIPDVLGFSTLIEYIRQTRKTSDASASDVSGLQDDIQGLAEHTARTFGNVDSALAGMDVAKADKPEAVSFTIPTTDWGSDSTAGYPKYYDITVSGITANDRASVAIPYGSLAAARACGMCPTNETLAGKIRIRAAKVPTANITVQYWVEKGKE